MQAKLTVIGGKANKREVVINLPATIGRSREADLTVGHRMISRKHCEAHLVDGLLMIRDHGSLNGTYVHGKRIREAPLLPNEKFTIGPITFRVSYEYNGDRSNLPPIIPAEAPAAGDTMEVSDAAAAKPAETTPKEKEPVTEPVKPKANSQPAAKPAPVKPTVAKPAPAKPAPPPDDEPDFQIVQEDDDDFELALQEDLGEQFKPAAKEPEKKPAAQKAPEKKPVDKKPVKKEEEPEEKDPEDQLLDDFLNDLQ
jgi:pSer/pThr/pTyr-binding forkhead associated (FHA) protein